MGESILQAITSALNVGGSLISNAFSNKTRLLDGMTADTTYARTKELQLQKSALRDNTLIVLCIVAVFLILIIYLKQKK